MSDNGAYVPTRQTVPNAPVVTDRPGPGIGPPREPGHARHRAGDLDGAEAACRRILQPDPRHADALHLLGLLAYHRGRHSEAADAIALGPGRPAFLYNLGVALKALGRDPHAIAAYEGALRLRPGDPDALSNLGVALHEAGRPDEAILRFEAALRADPDHADALYNFANLLRLRGEGGQAVAMYRRAREIVPRRADILAGLGGTLMDRGRDAEAIESLRHALEIDPAAYDTVTITAPAAHAALGPPVVSQAFTVSRSGPTTSALVVQLSNVGGGLTHGGVLLGLVGHMVCS